MDWKTIFMNISSDNVQISDWQDISISLSRNNLENILWKELVELNKKIWFKNVIVLNWPGGFTNLRVGTLCLNVLNTLLKNQLSFYNISKIELYEKTYKLWYLPKYGVIYIWQKRNIWLWDFEKNEKIWQYSFDELKNLWEMWNIENVFIDNVEEEKYYPERMDKYMKCCVSFDCENILLIDNKTGKSNQILISDLWLKEIKSITPNYMMDPSITLK